MNSTHRAVRTLLGASCEVIMTAIMTITPKAMLKPMPSQPYVIWSLIWLKKVTGLVVWLTMPLTFQYGMMVYSPYLGILKNTRYAILMISTSMKATAAMPM